MKKVFLLSLISVSVYFTMLAISWWQSELIYPIEKSILASSFRGKIPEMEVVDELERASRGSPLNAQYEILKGKFFIYNLALNEKRNRREKDYLSKGRESFFKALLLNPVYLENLAHLGWIDFSEGNAKAGTYKFEQAVKLSPQNYYVHLLYGIAIMNFFNVFIASDKNSYLEKVHSEISEAITLNPAMANDLSVIQALSKYYINKKDLISAVKEIEKIRIFDSQTFPMHAKLASLYFKIGKSVQGVKKYAQLLDILNGKNRNAGNHSLKLIRELRKKYKNLFLSAMIKDTNENYLDLDARLLLGRIYIQERLYARALHEMNFIIKHQSNLFMAYYIQGLANEALGYDKAAFIDYEYTLRYNSNHEGAASRLKELLKRGVSP